MKVKGKMAKDTAITANLRDYLREHHREVHDLIIEDANNNTRTYNMTVAHVLRGWASVHAEDLDKAIAHVDKWLDEMVSPDEGESS